MLAWYGAPGPLPGYCVLQLPPKFGEIDVGMNGVIADRPSVMAEVEEYVPAG